MMDYYSNYPAPSYEECKNIIKNELLNSPTINKLIENKTINLNNLVEQAFILSDMIENNEIKHSMTGWQVFGFKTVLSKSLYIVSIKEKKRRIRNKRLLRGLIKSTYLLFINYKDTKEKMYKPNSDFMKEIYSKYS